MRRLLNLAIDLSTGSSYLHSKFVTAILRLLNVMRVFRILRMRRLKRTVSGSTETCS